MTKVMNIGTVSIENGSTELVGSGTPWKGLVKKDDVFRKLGYSIGIAAAPAASTSATLVEPWPGPTLVDEPYEIAITPSGPEFQLNQRKLIEQLQAVQATSACLFYTFEDATADAKPGDGKLRFNDVVPEDVTEGFIDNIDGLGADVSGVIDTWDDTGGSGNRGQLWVRSIDTLSVFHCYQVTGSIVDGTGYRKPTLEHVGGSGAFLDGGGLLVFFVPIGPQGIQGIPTSIAAGNGIDVDATDPANPVVSVETNLQEWNGVNPSTDGKALVSAADYAAMKVLLDLGNVTNESKATMFSSAALTGTPTAPTAAAATNTTQIATTAFVYSVIAAQDAMRFKGVIDCSANPNYPAADAGDTYRVSVAGKIGGGSGPNVQAGDILLCLADSTASGNHATVGSSWGRIQVDIDGALVTTDIGVSVQGYSADLSDLVTRWVPASASGPASLDFLEDADNGSHKLTVSAPSALAADRTATFQDASGQLALIENLGLAFAVGSNALTASLKQADGATDPTSTQPVNVLMRNATAATGSMTLRQITAALSLTISSGSTLNHVSGLASVIYWYLIDNAGTLELAASATDFGETGIQSTTAEGGAGAADSGTAMYSTTARASVAFRRIGYTIDTQATAGTWAAVPSTVVVGPTARPARASFSATKGGTDQTGILSGTDTKITFTTEVFDTGGYYDATNSRWYPPPGLVMISATIRFTAGIVDQAAYVAIISKNGSLFKQGTIVPASGTGPVASNATVFDVADGDDYYEAFAYGGGTGNKTVGGLATWTYFMGATL